jgi:RimJ/RimL family protein N-acetyltransferase
MRFPIDDLSGISEGLWNDGVVELGWLAARDAPALHACDRDAEHRRRFELPETHVPALEHTLSIIAAWERARARGTLFGIAVRLLSGETVGGCEVRPRDAGVVNLSYWTTPTCRGQGYCKRGVQLACAWLNGVEGLDIIEVLVARDNDASRRVAAACGFEQVGTRDDNLLHVKRNVSPKQRRCLREQARVEFPAPEAGIVTVQCPLVFEP